MGLRCPLSCHCSPSAPATCGSLGAGLIPSSSHPRSRGNASHHTLTPQGGVRMEPWLVEMSWPKWPKWPKCPKCPTAATAGFVLPGASFHHSKAVFAWQHPWQLLAWVSWDKPGFPQLLLCPKILNVLNRTADCLWLV